MIKVFVGLGGNIGDPLRTLQDTLELIKSHPGIHGFKASRLYRTRPVSPIPQADYINAVCSFYTEMASLDLLRALQKIETQMGKVPKPKEAPRCIDCDILFYGDQQISLPELEIPHPRWRERLFVLAPLADLVDILQVPGLLSPISLQRELQEFPNLHHERVVPIEV